VISANWGMANTDLILHALFLRRHVFVHVEILDVSEREEVVGSRKAVFQL
jgi:hypothetical protein